MTEKSTISEESISPELGALLGVAEANSAAFDAAVAQFTQGEYDVSVIQRPNGTGLDYSDVVAQIAKTNLANAEQAGEATWEQLLDVAVTEVRAEANPVELAVKLVALEDLVLGWLQALKEVSA